MTTQLDIEKIRTNPTILLNFQNAVQTLRENLVTYVIRALGRPVRDHKSTPDFLASEAAYSAGWNDCLDTLLNFEETVLRKTPTQHKLSADYGARRTLLERGDITLEEFNQLGHDNSSADAKRSVGPAPGSKL